MTKTPKQRAEDALMDYLEDFASNLGDRGARRSDNARYFPSRQMTQMRRSYDEGRLLEDITSWVDEYVFRPTAASRRMEENAIAIVDGGHTMWEEGLADPNAAWAPFVTPHQRAVLNDLVARIYRNVASRRKLRAQIQAQQRRTGT